MGMRLCRVPCTMCCVLGIAAVKHLQRQATNVAQVWLELYRTPSEEDRELVSEVFQSWYMLGRLGGFNGMNMQAGNFTIECRAPGPRADVSCRKSDAIRKNRCSTKVVTTQAIWLMMRRNASRA